ncbi:LuxR C-terminal-related transcriptional regulator [Streptomyces kaempferi]
MAADLDGARHAHRRAWHLAAATTGPDEEVAAELERVAEWAGSRQAMASASAAYERAARLTADPHRHARRLITAAQKASEAGQDERCRTLTDQVPLPLRDPGMAADFARVRSVVELGYGSPRRAARILADCADTISADRPDKLAPLLTDAVHAAFCAGDAPLMVEIGVRAPHLPILALPAHLLAGDLPGARRALDTLVRAGRLADVGLMDQLVTAIYCHLMADHATAHELAAAAVAHCREQGIGGWLPTTLHLRAQVELTLGSSTTRTHTPPKRSGWPTATTWTTEQPICAPCWRCWPPSKERRRRPGKWPNRHWSTPARARSDGARRSRCGRWGCSTSASGGRRTRCAIWRRPGRRRATLPGPAPVAGSDQGGRTRRTSGRGAGTRGPAHDMGGRPRTAPLHCPSAPLRGPDQPGHTGRAALSGRLGPAHRQQRLRSGAHPPPLRRVAAPLAPQHRRPRPTAHRTEKLRSAERPALGPPRSHGTPGSGRNPRPVRRHRLPLTRLSAQEREVVRLAATGATNREIATHLFLSPRTVAHHLYRAFPKLGISSRTELANLLTP